MTPIEKIRVLFSPLDYIIVTKKFEYLAPADQEVIDLPPNFFDVARSYLGVGDYWDRNPTVWYIFQGKKVDLDSKEFQNGVNNFYRLINDHNIQELDDNFDHITLTVNFEILVENAKQLEKNAFEEIECATVKTSFGDFPLIEKDTP